MGEDAALAASGAAKSLVSAVALACQILRKTDIAFALVRDHWGNICIAIWHYNCYMMPKG